MENLHNLLTLIKNATTWIKLQEAGNVATTMIKSSRSDYTKEQIELLQQSYLDHLENKWEDEHLGLKELLS